MNAQGRARVSARGSIVNPARRGRALTLACARCYRQQGMLEALRSLAFVLGSAVLGCGTLWLLVRLWATIRARARVSVEGRWVAITGCDSGFGERVMRGMIERGAQVIAICFSEQGAAAATQAGAAVSLRVDLREPAEIERAAAEIRRVSGGSLWGIVHNAGVAQPGFVDYLSDAVYRRVMAVNFFAPVFLTRRLLPALRRAGGRVVLVSSVDGIVSLPGNAAYDASKFALEGYADALRVELSFAGVEVSVVNPSTMRTPLAMRFFEGHRATWAEMQAEDPEGAWARIYSREWLEQFIAFNGPQLERIAQDPRHAAEDIIHALTARRPSPRYLSGHLAKTLFYALWVAPPAWADRFKRATVQPPPRAGRG